MFNWFYALIGLIVGAFIRFSLINDKSGKDDIDLLSIISLFAGFFFFGFSAESGTTYAIISIVEMYVGYNLYKYAIEEQKPNPDDEPDWDKLLPTEDDDSQNWTSKVEEKNAQYQEESSKFESEVDEILKTGKGGSFKFSKDKKLDANICRMIQLVLNYPSILDDAIEQRVRLIDEAHVLTDIIRSSMLIEGLTKLELIRPFKNQKDLFKKLVFLSKDLFPYLNESQVKEELIDILDKYEK